jgi:hypothetical protein
LTEFNVVSLQDRRKRYDLLCLHKIVHSSIDAPNLLSSLSISTSFRTRNPKIFAIQVYKNNTSYYNPLVRMSRSYNELEGSSADVDVFNSNFLSFKKIISDLLGSGSHSH